MMIIDIRTLFLFTFIIYLFLTILAFMFWAVHRNRIEGINLVLLGSCLFSICSILISLRNTIPDSISIIAANMFLLLAICTLFAGILKTGELETSYIVETIVISTTVLLFTYFTYFFNNLRMRIIILSISMIILIFKPLIRIYRNFREYRLSRLLISLFGTLFIISLFSRGIHAAVVSPGFDFMKPHTNQAVYIMLFDLLVISLTIGYIILVSEKIQNREKAELSEKSLLLNELYHRTRNNMYVISSILQLHKIHTDDEKLNQIIDDIETKITAMSLVQEKLFKERKLTRINLRDYIIQLTENMLNILDKSKRISTMYDIDNIEVSLDTAVPLGLALNEIISNTHQHGFSRQEKGDIRITAREGEDSEIRFVVSDNGSGFPPGFNPETSNTIGLKTLINIVQVQLNGSIRFSGNRGVTCIIIYRDNIYAKRIDYE